MKHYRVKVAQQILETAEVEIVVPDEMDMNAIEKIAVQLADNKGNVEWSPDSADQTYVLNIQEVDL